MDDQTFEEMLSRFDMESPEIVLSSYSDLDKLTYRQKRNLINHEQLTDRRDLIFLHRILEDVTLDDIMHGMRPIEFYYNDKLVKMKELMEYRESNFIGLYCAYCNDVDDVEILQLVQQGTINPDNDVLCKMVINYLYNISNPEKIIDLIIEIDSERSFIDSDISHLSCDGYNVNTPCNYIIKLIMNHEIVDEYQNSKLLKLFEYVLVNYGSLLDHSNVILLSAIRLPIEYLKISVKHLHDDSLNTQISDHNNRYNKQLSYEAIEILMKKYPGREICEWILNDVFKPHFNSASRIFKVLMYVELYINVEEVTDVLE